jgi:hypothetical protein
VTVAEVHRDIAHLRPCPRHLRPEADRHALVGLDADDQRILTQT